MTGASVVMGTPYYMSPEQLRNSHDVDERADIYSVGVVLLRGAHGQHAHRCAAARLADAQDEIPPAMDEIVARCVDPIPTGASRMRRSCARRSRGMGSAPGRELAAPRGGIPHRSLRGGRSWAWACSSFFSCWSSVGWRGLDQRRHRRSRRGWQAQRLHRQRRRPGENLCALGELERLATRTSPGGSPLASAFEEGPRRLEAARATASADDGGAQRGAEEALQPFSRPRSVCARDGLCGPGRGAQLRGGTLRAGLPD